MEHSTYHQKETTILYSPGKKQQKMLLPNKSQNKVPNQNKKKNQKHQILVIRNKIHDLSAVIKVSLCTVCDEKTILSFSFIVKAAAFEQCSTGPPLAFFSMQVDRVL